MEYRPLGKTGLNVSALSYGASSLGGVFHDVREAEGIRALRESLDLGVNYVDVSPYYGNTRAERVLGRGLKGVGRDRYYLSTKVGRYGPEQADFDFSAGRVARSVDESLGRLGLDHVDLILCHDIEFGRLDQIVEETLPALRRAQERGKARFVGITGLPLKVFRAVAERAELDAVLSYCHHSLNDDALLGLVPYLKGRGVGVINAAPISMGLLSSRPPPPWHPAPERVKAACRRAVAACAEAGTPIEKLAVQFSARNPDLATTLVSSASPEEMRRNIAWAGEPIDPELLGMVTECLAPAHNVTWPSGRPENN